MVSVNWTEIMNMFTSVFYSCVRWFESLLDRLDAAPILLAVIGLSIVVSLLLIPLRGAAGSFAGGYTHNTTSKFSKNRSSEAKSKTNK